MYSCTLLYETPAVIKTCNMIISGGACGEVSRRVASVTRPCGEIDVVVECITVCTCCYNFITNRYRYLIEAAILMHGIKIK